MRYDGVYKAYKLYSVTEQDIAETGGARESRYIKNSVLVFLPDIEKPEIGTELLSTDNMKSAKVFIDDTDGTAQRTAQEIFEAATIKSKELERQKLEQQENINREEERRRRERQEEYERETRA